MDRGEHEAVTVGVEEGGGEGEPAPHVTEGVVAHDRDPRERGVDLGAQRGRLGRPERGGPLGLGDPSLEGAQPTGEDEREEEGGRRDGEGDGCEDLHEVRR